MTGIDLGTVVPALLAIILLIDVSVLWITGRQVPQLLTELVFAVIGFYFGRVPGSKKKEGP